MGVHAAGFAAPPELSPAQVADDPDYGGHRFFAFRHVEDIRSIMEAYGDDETRIAILEFGWTSDSYTKTTSGSAPAPASTNSSRRTISNAPTPTPKKTGSPGSRS
ncbi:MAG: hypothetical protein R2856_29145 [Caldilineaceae bacterium]